MSKNNNVRPDHFKTAGREPPGQGVAHEVLRQEFEEVKAREKRAESPTAKRARPEKKVKPAK